MNELILMGICAVAIVASVAFYHRGFRHGVARVEQIVRDHRDAMNANFNCMKLEAQEKARKIREEAAKGA